MITACLVCVVVFLVMVYIIQGRYQNSSRMQLPPGTMGWPLIGETLEFLSNKEAYTRKRIKLYGRVYKTSLFGMSTIRVIGADNFSKILRGDDDIVYSNYPRSTKTILGDNLITASGVQHKILKRIVFQSFSRTKLREIVVPLQNIIQSSIKEWCSQRSVDGYCESKCLAATVVLRLILGVQVNREEAMVAQELIDKLSKGVISLPVYIPGTTFYKAIQAKLKLLELFRTWSSDNKRTSKGECCALEYIRNTAHHRPELDGRSLNSLPTELMFLASGTSSSAIFAILYLLADNSDNIIELREELNIFSLLCDENGIYPEINFEKLNELTYLDSVVNESLRMHPPAPGVFRSVKKDFKLQNYDIPTGWTIICSFNDANNLSDIYHEPSVFNPKRWTKRSNPLPPYTFTPFGAGQRVCAGKEFAKLFIKIFLIELVRRCDFCNLSKGVGVNMFPAIHPKEEMKFEFRTTNTIKRT